MSARASFDYAVFRFVPRVEREEFLNVGVILICPERRFLDVKTRLDRERLQALWPELDMEQLDRHIEVLHKICAGGPDSGSIGRLSQRERFHWLTSPRSTILQPSPVRTGLCTGEMNLNEILDQLSQKLL
ncbi:MAG: DUF3037 domain-containing protein [Edaphobacter sp.]